MSPQLHCFEEREDLRSAFVRELVLRRPDHADAAQRGAGTNLRPIPKTLVRYWHDPSNVPDDVRACLDTWDRLAAEGFEFRTFDDRTAAAYIKRAHGAREGEAFARCPHPAMRCDYLRLCYLVVEGGLYVDADDVLLGDGWKRLFRDGRLKLQPLCYDLTAGAMAPVSDFWTAEVSEHARVFYVNNDPIAAPAGHPVLGRALQRATAKLLNPRGILEIQSTTGPGNLTVALAEHARLLRTSGLPDDFELLRDWDTVAQQRWALSYRQDERNWRNVYGC